MGFGGAATMNAVIKNNRNLLKKNKRVRFKKERSNFNLNQDYQYPKATAKQLRDLKFKLKAENRERQIKIYAIVCFIILCLITALVYLA